MQRKCLNWKAAAPGAMPMSAWAWLNSMPTKTWAWHPVLAALLLLATGAGTGRADPPPAEPTAQPKEIRNSIDTEDIDPTVAAAWKKAGAEVVWICRIPVNAVQFEQHRPPGEAVHGFCLEQWPADGIRNLPAPATPFGLYVRTRLTPAHIQELAGLKKLRMLSLSYNKMTDEGMKVLANLSDLRDLDLNMNHDVGDAGIKELAGLKHLQRLDLSMTEVSDDGLKELSGLKEMRGMYLGSTKVTNAGLKHLAGMTDLQTLEVRSTRVTDDGLKHLAGLKHLETLDLYATNVTDDGLKQLAGLAKLQTLHLSNTKVTGTGLRHLAGLKELRTLKLTFAPVTDAGLKEVVLSSSCRPWMLVSPALRATA